MARSSAASRGAAPEPAPARSAPSRRGVRPGFSGLRDVAVFRLPAAVLFTLALLAPAAPAVAQSDTIFVSTLGQPLGSVGSITASGGRAQQFTAGAAAVALSAIAVDIGTASATAAADVDLYTSVGGEPGTKVVDLNGSVASTGEASFVPATATTLSASTAYFVVFRGTGGNYGVRNTSSDTVDAGPSAGWDIADTSRVSNDNGASWSSSSTTLRIAVKGSDTVPVTLPTLSVADASVTEGTAAVFTVTLSPAGTVHGDGGLDGVGHRGRRRQRGSRVGRPDGDALGHAQLRPRGDRADDNGGDGGRRKG